MANQLNLFLPDENASVLLATNLAALIIIPLILTFSGEIGAGKTTIIRAMLRAIGIESSIKSPTFSLVESYQCNNIQIHHMDLYRIVDINELEYLGFRDYFTSDSLCCIEWPKNLLSHYIEPDLNFTLSPRENGRELQCCAQTNNGLALLSELRSRLIARNNFIAYDG